MLRPFLLLILAAPIVFATPDPAEETTILARLDKVFPAVIASVEVGTDDVTISGRAPGDGAALFLADIPMELPRDDPRGWETRIPLEISADGEFRETVPRVRPRGSHRHDRLLSRWQLIRVSASGEIEALSQARHADGIASRRPVPPPSRPKTKKGLGGWNAGRIPGELDDLGISAVTVNVPIHTLVSPDAGPGTRPFRWQGRTWHAREAALKDHDATFLEAARRGATVSAILLVANPARNSSPLVERLAHPDATPEGIYAMPDVASEEGAALYGAILHLMAERWSHADGRHGRIHHWIVHNEVDAGRVWTNAGEKGPAAYMDLYQRSLRLVDLIVRQYDPHARAFISLTHHWAHPGNPGWYGSRRMLELLARFCRAEGDFPWALAHHPYPQDLFNPRTWEDTEATFGFDTAKITPRNLEVLDAWMRRDEMRYRGETRLVHLSENGFNSRDYSPERLAEQAAGMAYAWKKISGLGTIGAWHYHNWIDHPDEGGLRIGLRKFAADANDPLGRKPVWHLYKALATPEEDRASAPFLGTIGIGSWDEAIHRGKLR